MIILRYPQLQTDLPPVVGVTACKQARNEQRMRLVAPLCAFRVDLSAQNCSIVIASVVAIPTVFFLGLRLSASDLRIRQGPVARDSNLVSATKEGGEPKQEAIECCEIGRALRFSNSPGTGLVLDLTRYTQLPFPVD